MKRGYVKLWRKTIESGLMQNPEIFTFFVWALLKASHKPYKHLVGLTMVELLPGQFVTGIDAAAQELKTTPRKIRTALSTLEKLQILTRKTTNKFSVVTLINWETYQPDAEESDKLGDKQLTIKRQTVDSKQELKNKRTKEKELKTPCADESPRFPVEDHFESFWTHYPKRNGKRVGKGDALAKYKLIVKTEFEAHTLFACVTNYSFECSETDSYPMDAKRWLVAKRWEEYKDDVWEAPIQEAAQPKETETQRMIRVAQEMEAQNDTLRIT